MFNTMVVDDEYNIVKLVIHWAKKMGLKPQGFTDPVKALEAFQEGDFKLLITDLKMPGMNGHELLRKVKLLSPETEVIIITGHGDIEDAVDAMRQEVYDFIRKPFLAKELTQCLERVVDTIILKDENRRLMSDLKEMNRNLERQVEKRTSQLTTKNRELEKIDEIKSKFIACVSHELRTPLTQIDSGLFVLNTILDKKATDSEKKLLNIVRVGSKRLNSVVQHMTTMLQAEYQDGLLRKERISVNQLVREAHQEVGYFAGLRNQTFESRLPESEIYFDCDKGKFYDVLLNICMNAVKFTPDHGTICISLEGSDALFRVMVRDSGIGITDDDKLHIFKKFYEAADMMFHSSGTFQFKAGGLGLGLSIAKLFTEMHGGKILVESEGKDKGSTFIMEFPLRPEDIQ